jgi:hypothetical protein
MAHDVEDTLRKIIKEQDQKIAEKAQRIKELEDELNYMRIQCEKLKQVNAHMKGEITGLSFAVRCNGIEGGSVQYGENKRI